MTYRVMAFAPETKDYKWVTVGDPRKGTVHVQNVIGWFTVTDDDPDDPWVGVVAGVLQEGEVVPAHEHILGFPIILEPGETVDDELRSYVAAQCDEWKQRVKEMKK